MAVHDSKTISGDQRVEHDQVSDLFSVLTLMDVDQVKRHPMRE